MEEDQKNRLDSILDHLLFANQATDDLVSALFKGKDDRDLIRLTEKAINQIDRAQIAAEKFKRELAYRQAPKAGDTFKAYLLKNRGLD